MKQLAIDPELIIDIKLTGAASLLKPVVFREGNVYCCILGPDPTEGIFGCGDTPEKALADWDETLQLTLKECGNDHPVVKYVKQVLANIPRPAHLQEFYAQFRPVKNN